MIGGIANLIEFRVEDWISQEGGNRLRNRRTFLSQNFSLIALGSLQSLCYEVGSGIVFEILACDKRTSRLINWIADTNR